MPEAESVQLEGDALSAAVSDPSHDVEQAGASRMADEKGDPDVVHVTWDGLADPANPRNWSKVNKTLHITLVSGFVLYSNLSTTMFAPGADELAAEFGITNTVVIALTVTISVLGFSLGPLVFAPLSEVYGRLPIYHVCSCIFVGFTIGLARSTNVAMFLVFRFICGCAASAFMTCGGGTIADLVEPEERGAATAVFTAGPLLGPVIGPVIGGFVTETIGWRWTFWLILIIAGFFTVISFIVMRETNAGILLARKAERLRRETGNMKLRAVTDKGLTPRQILKRAIVRPIKMLVFSPMIILLSLYVALVFGVIYLFFATFPMVFKNTYGFSTGIAGLCYLGLGLGTSIGLILFSLLSDRMMKKKKNENLVRPELRLVLMMWFSPAVPAGIFWYGWSTYYKTHWIVPILGTGVLGLGAIFIFTPSQVYLIDVYGAQAAASALAALTIVRNMSGAFLALAAPPLYNNLGLGWGNSLLGFILLGFIPVPFLFYKYGEWMRNKFPINL